jgi:steroid delta-isomerase
MAERVLEQCRLFNEGVRTGDWSGYLAHFAGNATLRIAGDPGSPYVGREAIAAAYAAAPPDDTITVTSVASDGDADVARFTWDAGGAGTLRLRWSAGRIVEFEAAFDAPE